MSGNTVVQDAIAADKKNFVSYGKELTAAITEQSFWNPAMKMGKNAILRVDNQLEGKDGSGTAEFRLRGLARGEGVDGNTDFVDNLDDTNSLSQVVKAEIFGNAFKSQDERIDKQSQVTDFRTRTKEDLQDWGQDRTDRTITARLSAALTSIAPCKAGGGIYAVNGTSSTKAGDIITVAAIKNIATMAKTGKKADGTKGVKLRPYKMLTKNEEGLQTTQYFYLLVLSTLQAGQLTNDPEWIKMQELAAERGENNRLFGSELGNVRNVKVVEYEEWSYETSGIISSKTTVSQKIFGKNNPAGFDFSTYKGVSNLETEMGLFLGANAGLIGMDNGFKYYEDDQDAGRKMLIGIDRYWAFNKTKYIGTTAEEMAMPWHNQDYGVIGVATSKE